MQVVDCSSRLKIALRLSIRDQGFSGTSSSSAGFAASLRRWCFSSSSFSGSLSGCSSGNLNLNFVDASVFSRSGARLSFLGSQSAVGCKLGCGRLSERSRAAVVMAANGSLLGKLHLRSGFLTSLGLLSSSSALSSSSNVAVFTCGLKPVVMCWNVSGNTDGQDRRRMQFLHSCSFDGCGIWGSPAFPSSLQKIREFHSSGSAACSAGTASELSFGGSSRDDLLDNTTVSSSDQKKSGDAKLKLRSGSCYLPHPDKEETGGEDAHFICTEEQAIGVADGVGGWADLGVDAGQYARELMSHSVEAIQEEPKGSVDPSRVLEKAYSITKARGSSTACIIALNEQGIQAVNLGDSGFIVVRDGCTVFRSPVQQHDFNFTYQLENGNHSDLPSSGQIFNISVAPGDVIIAGTDGLFDNLYNNEVTAVVVHAIRAGLGPQVTAQKIAALARQRALDQSRQTPFSTAAQDAGYRYYGGKLDDITVVVSYITSTSASR